MLSISYGCMKREETRKRYCVGLESGGKKRFGRCKHPGSPKNTQQQREAKTQSTNWDLAFQARPRKWKETREQEEESVYFDFGCVAGNAPKKHRDGRSGKLRQQVAKVATEKFPPEKDEARTACFQKNADVEKKVFFFV